MRRWLFIFLMVSTPISIALWWWSKTATFERQYDVLIQPIAQELKIDPLLVRALIWRESRFNPRTRGKDGERGLMQIMEIAALDWTTREKIQDFDHDRLFDPETNIRVGSWLLARSMRRWADTDDPVVFALAEYNAGRSNALRWVDPERPRDADAFLNRIDYPGTKKYVRVITGKYSQYKKGYIQPPWVTMWQDWSGRISRKLGMNQEIR